MIDPCSFEVILHPEGHERNWCLAVGALLMWNDRQVGNMKRVTMVIWHDWTSDSGSDSMWPPHMNGSNPFYKSKTGVYLWTFGRAVQNYWSMSYLNITLVATARHFSLTPCLCRGKFLYFKTEQNGSDLVLTDFAPLALQTYLIFQWFLFEQQKTDWLMVEHALNEYQKNAPEIFSMNVDTPKAGMYMYQCFNSI